MTDFTTQTAEQSNQPEPRSQQARTGDPIPAPDQDREPVPARDQGREPAPVPSDRDNPLVDDTLPLGENASETSLDFPRIAWSITTVAFLIAMVVLLLRGDLGYAGVTLAVALAAAINLF